MSRAPLPPDIEILDQWPESYSYRLPRRNVGGTRWFGLALLLFGLLVAAGVVSLVLSFVFNVHLIWRGATTIAFLLAIPTCAGIFPIWWGLGVLVGRRELVIKNGKLRTIEWIGPFWYSKAWPLNTISRFHITSLTPVNEENPQPAPQWSKNWDALAVFSAGGKRNMLAWGYRQELLEPLAFDLCERIHHAICAVTPVAEEDKVDKPYVTSDYKELPTPYGDLDDEDLDDEFDDDDEDFEHEAELPPSTEQPKDSPIAVERFDDGLTITVPPAGLWKGTSGLFFFSLLWNGVMCLFTAIVIAAWFNNADAIKKDDSSWIPALFLGLFWLVGICVFLGALNMGRRRAAIAVAGDALMVIQSGPLGTKRKEWPLESITRIAPGASGIKVNDVDVLELQIHDRDHHKFGMLAGRRNEELYWLGAVLSEALGSSAAMLPADAEPAIEPAEEKPA